MAFSLGSLLGVAGTLAGTAVGGPAGGAVGGALGGLAGGVVDDATKPDEEKKRKPVQQVAPEQAEPAPSTPQPANDTLPVGVSPGPAIEPRLFQAQGQLSNADDSLTGQTNILRTLTGY